MQRAPPRSTATDTVVPDTTGFRAPGPLRRPANRAPLRLAPRDAAGLLPLGRRPRPPSAGCGEVRDSLGCASFAGGSGVAEPPLTRSAALPPTRGRREPPLVLPTASSAVGASSGDSCSPLPQPGRASWWARVCQDG